MSNLEERIGKVIRKRRTELGISERKMAKKLYVSYSTFNGWERGAHLMSIIYFFQICEILGLKMEDFMEET